MSLSDKFYNQKITFKVDRGLNLLLLQLDPSSFLLIF